VVRRWEPGWRNRRGASKLGCLITLAVLAVVVYYGIGIGGHYFRYFRLLDEMKTQARLATNVDNATIRNRVLAMIEQLQLPDDARRLTIRRTVRPRQITISTSYQVAFELPFYVHTHTFNPQARAPL
jgi:hypothetical protein